MNTKISLVKSFFAEPEQYLKSDFNIRIRAEIIKEFVGDTAFDSILDIGCGTGAISLPLLHQTEHLTLLDFSSNMLSIARAHVPVELLGKVDMINDDFMNSELKSNSYDLILCLGVLAHVDSPTDVINKIVSLLKTGGGIIVQNTDCRHPISYLFNSYWALRSIILQSSYSLNRISNTSLMRMLINHGLALLSIYRYSLPVPGMARVLSSDNLYKLIKQIYGTATNKHFSCLGSECIYYFRK